MDPLKSCFYFWVNIDNTTQTNINIDVLFRAMHILISTTSSIYHMMISDYASQSTVDKGIVNDEMALLIAFSISVDLLEDALFQIQTSIAALVNNSHCCLSSCPCVCYLHAIGNFFNSLSYRVCCESGFDPRKGSLIAFEIWLFGCMAGLLNSHLLDLFDSPKENSSTSLILRG